MSRVLISLALFSFLASCRDAEVPAAAPPPAPAPVTATVPAAVPATTASAAEAPSHDLTGAYFPMNELPAEFAELEHLLLATIDENAEPAPLNGFLRPKDHDAKDYTLVNPALDGKNLTFRTVAVNGVQYEFSGAFDVLDNFAANPPSYETAVLTGTLTKLRNGKSVASTPVQFRYEAGG
ncbi:MAG: hypothetical protein ACJ74H_02205 [Thermoanaerobaculia bacterium]